MPFSMRYGLRFTEVKSSDTASLMANILVRLESLIRTKDGESEQFCWLKHFYTCGNRDTTLPTYSGPVIGLRGVFTLHSVFGSPAALAFSENRSETNTPTQEARCHFAAACQPNPAIIKTKPMSHVCRSTQNARKRQKINPAPATQAG